MAIWFIYGILLLWVPIRKLQKMPCPYCSFAARVGVLPFRHFRCMCCYRSIVESMDKLERLKGTMLCMGLGGHTITYTYNAAGHLRR